MEFLLLIPWLLLATRSSIAFAEEQVSEGIRCFIAAVICLQPLIDLIIKAFTNG